MNERISAELSTARGRTESDWRRRRKVLTDEYHECHDNQQRNNNYSTLNRTESSNDLNILRDVEDLRENCHPRDERDDEDSDDRSDLEDVDCLESSEQRFCEEGE